MKKTVLLLLTGTISLGNAQVGIKTPTPQKTLHVNGSLQVTNELNLGGDGTTEGNAGNIGQALVSNGPGFAPSWSDQIGGNSVVKMGALVQRTLQPANNGPAGSTKVIFDSVPLIDNSKVEYDTTTGNFTFASSGYYQVLATTYMNLQNNAAGTTSGTGTSTIYVNGTASSNVQGQTTANYSERTEFVRHTTGATFFAAAGDVMTVFVSHTRPYRLWNGAVTINYLGN